MNLNKKDMNLLDILEVKIVDNEIIYDNQGISLIALFIIGSSSIAVSGLSAAKVFFKGTM